MNNQNKKVFLAIAAVILVAISVVALVYTYNHSAPAGSVNIQSISIVPNNNNPRVGDLTVVLSNNGSTAITGVSVTSFDGNALNGAIPLVMSPILPGQSGNAVYSYMPSPVALQVGQVYSLVLKVTFASGATRLITTTATVANMPPTIPIFPTAPSITIQDVTISNGKITLIVQNSGGVALSAMSVSVYQNGETVIGTNPSWNSTVIAPGATATFTEDLSEIPGSSYLIVVSATTPNGGSVEATTTVVADTTPVGSTINVADVQDVSLVPSSTGGTLYVTISNGGATEITGVSVVSFNGATVTNGAMTLSPSPLASGQTGYATFSITSGSFVAGQTYSLVLSISFANGASQLITTTATVSSGLS
ncbi:MAG: hypothetical protein QXV17_05285 [Candidatus Micrarchaeaceae archaeon]